ncbi:MAG: 4-(cytidine 5'-diphospho)-2-C-methyl-D-erythritol kinase [Brevinematales bacterium]|nr:4-(cytidine 5'-diphospho)-2-C-methyl-D-erythritol kinase [Brevinematales bacterium]
MKILSRAKLNLFLDITGKDPSDGYHYIDSLFQEISLADEILIEESVADSIEFRGIDIPGTDTTVHRALRMFRDTTGVLQKYRIVTDKHIPTGAGLGGGSSNAAAVLSALAEMNGIPARELIPVGARIGSDVPFFFTGGLCRVRGKGELIEPLAGRLDGLHFIVAYPDIHISTKWAYSLIDGYGTGLAEDEILKKRAIDIDFLRKIMYNRFQGKIFDEEEKLSALKEKLDLELRAEISMMSGSGSSLFFVYESERIRDEVFEIIKNIFNYRFFRCDPVYRTER